MQCVLHIGKNDSAENVIPFTAESLQVCDGKKAIRDSVKKKKSKFDGIILPDEADGVAGYHASCYKLFCAVKTKQSDPEKSNKGK